LASIKTILVFGNPLVKKDRLPLILMPELRKAFPNIEFKEFDAVEDLHREGKILYILDSVEGIDQVEVITDIDMLLVNKIYSVHDFDLAYTLKLMKKMDMVEKVVIFGVPMKIRKDQAIRQLKQKIGSILS
jgi:Ni,Fe-hydrogenase maturation factor